jgi:hypothetical protein
MQYLECLEHLYLYEMIHCVLKWDSCILSDSSGSGATGPHVSLSGRSLQAVPVLVIICHLKLDDTLQCLYSFLQVLTFVQTVGSTQTRTNSFTYEYLNEWIDGWMNNQLLLTFCPKLLREILRFQDKEGTRIVLDR